MKAIIGLGNPGRQYHETRHNVGFMVVEELARRWAPGEPGKAKFNAVGLEARIADEKTLLMKPTTYMNRSGLAVGEVVRFHQMDPAEDLIVIVDDVALPRGDLRIRPEGSAGTHNGLTDIEQRLGTRCYPRLRIGLGEPGIVDRVHYVLGRFTEEERAVIDPAIRTAADACECWIREGTTTTMNRFNTPKRRNKDSDAASENENDPGNGTAKAPTAADE